MPLKIIRQDITNLKVDAIVNTTNSEMFGYSGVDYAIHHAAGKELDIECAKIAPLELGQAKITKGYKLPAKYVIHTVGPVWSGENYKESEALKSCYLESLKLAIENKCKSIAFPLISSGVYGYPKDQVLKFAIEVITNFLFENELLVFLCVYDKESYEFSKVLFTEIKDYLTEQNDYPKINLQRSMLTDGDAKEKSLEETQDLLSSAGMTLSRGIVFDKIIRYFIQKEIYDIFEINQALFEFDQVLLGV